MSFEHTLKHTKSFVAFALMAVVTIGSSSEISAQDKKAAKFSPEKIKTALSYKPKQEVDYDYKGSPTAEMIKKAQMQSSAELFGKTGYVVADETNRVVRVLIDSNKDSKLDYFSYYKDGIEVYREVDTDYDSTPNEYRWLGSAGTRWGIDTNENGTIDQWKVISAEEVAYEVFMAIRNRDDVRYQRLLITDEEFRSLGLDGAIAKDAAARLQKARKDFSRMVQGQKTIDRSAKWINSGSGQPCIAAAGKGLTKDLLCHDHASSVFGSANGTDTLALGTLVKVGDAWRLMELPQVVPRGKAIENGGVLFPVVQITPPAPKGTEVVDGFTPELAKFYDDLTKLETAIEKQGRPGVQMANLQKERAMLQWKIYNKIPEKEKAEWVKNIGDTVSYAYQSGNYPEGMKFLESVMKTLKENKKTVSLDYVRWRMIHSDYYKRLEESDNREKLIVAKEYFKKLEAFVKEFPKSKYAPESLFLIGQNFEVSRNADVDKALQWYQACAQRYAASPYGKRAAGAVRRLGGRLKPVPFDGKTVDGKVFDISNRILRDRFVVVYFWTMRVADDKVNQKNETAFDVFQDLRSKYKDELVIVSANIEPAVTAADYKDFNGDLTGVFEMHAPGGMEDSPLATQLGIVTEPTMIVWDKEGNLVDAESGVGDLDRMIQRLKKKVANGPAARAAQKTEK